MSTSTPEPRVEQSAVYRVLMSDILFEQMGLEAVDWGQPDPDGFYTPTVRAVFRGPIFPAAPAAEPVPLTLDALRPALAEWDAIEGSGLADQFRAFIAAGKMADAIRAALASPDKGEPLAALTETEPKP